MNYDTKRIAELAYRYGFKIADVKRENRYISDFGPGSYTASQINDYKFASIDVPVAVAEIDLKKLKENLDILDEWRRLMSDGETAHMLQEARFIYKLRRGYNEI